MTTLNTRLIAYYLPQFHRIPENDRWWGKGFTEWTNVRRAVPQFEGHAQPQVPAELGYYDLTDPAVMQQQAELARAHGIHGFCYYWYWFADGKRLLEKPLERLLAGGTPDFPFCLCWANENWSRRWDGGEHEVLMAQDHQLDNNLACLAAMAPYFRDSRYVRVDGKPLLLIYRAELIPDLAAQVLLWRQRLRDEGVGEVYLVCVQSFDEKNPVALGFDAACEFPPHQIKALPINGSVPGAENFEGRLFDYRHVVLNKLGEARKPWRQLHGVMSGWDNTPRRKSKGTAFLHGSPQWYGHWLQQAIERTERDHPPEERLVFINAWNEWAEGAYLEPDQHQGRALLEATRDALERAAANAGPEDEAAQLRHRFAPWLMHLTPAQRAALVPAAPAPLLVQIDATEPGAAVAVADTLHTIAAQWRPPAAVQILVSEEAQADAAWHAQAEVAVEYKLAADVAAGAACAVEAARRHKCNRVLRLAAGDRLFEHAIFSLAEHAQLQRADLLYADEAMFDRDVYNAVADFKPDFDLDLARARPYLGGPFVVRTDLLHAFGLRAEMAGVEEHDLVLRAAAVDPEVRVVHVPQLLALRCMAWRSGARRSLDAVNAALHRATREHLSAAAQEAEAADVHAGALPASSRVIYRHGDAAPHVTIAVTVRDRLPQFERCLTTLLQHTAYPHYDVLIINNLSRDAATRSFLDGLRQLPGDRVRVLDYQRPANAAAIANLAARNARGEFLLLLDAGTAVLHADWLDALLAQALRPDVGAVGARLVGLDGRIVHAGYALGVGGFATPRHRGAALDAPGLNGRLQFEHGVAALSGACLLTRVDTVERLGGFDDKNFPAHFADVDFCLRARAAGWRCVWTPHATLLHEEPAAPLLDSRLDDRPRLADGLRLWNRHLPAMAHDGAGNPNLSDEVASGVVEMDSEVLWVLPPRAGAAPSLPRVLPRVHATPIDGFGIGRYRLIEPLRALADAGRALTKCTRYPLTPVQLARFELDAVVLQRPFTKMGQRLLEDYEQLGIRRIIELDDLVTEVPASNAHAREVPRDIERWVRRAFERCERAIVSTEPLAEAVRRWRPDVRVVANRLPEAWRHLAPVRAHERRRPRVGWAGGIGHDGDLALLRQVLAPLSDEIDFVLFGLCPKALRPFVREFYPGVPFDRYPQALAALDLDVALAPLEVNRFNECKSNLRLLEYGALGWPVIATDIAPYRGTLPVTRVKNTTAAWVEAIRALAFDRDAAHAAGEQLRAAVLREGMLADHLDGWHAALFDARLDAPVDAPPVTTPRATLNTTQEHADVGA
jgi:hypothetical protein